MDTLILYSRPGCPRCNVVKIKLQQSHLEFTEVDNTDEVNKVVEISGITSAPILKVNNNYYDFSKAIDYIKRIN